MPNINEEVVASVFAYHAQGIYAQGTNTDALASVFANASSRHNCDGYFRLKLIKPTSFIVTSLATLHNHYEKTQLISALLVVE